MSCACDGLPPPGRPTAIAPGRGRLDRQPSTFADYRRSLFAGALTRPALQGWRSRAPGEAGVLLLELWAYVLDVVGFYDETIAHECFVRTARLPGSLRELVALLGYVPRPAVAATVALAALADGTDAVRLPAGTAFRSAALPDGGPPQVFELDTDIIIHPRWNAWPLAAVRPDVLPAPAEAALLLDPRGAALTPGDTILVTRPGGGQVVTVVSTGTYTADDGATYATASLDRPPGLPAGTSLAQVELLRPGGTVGLWKLPAPDDMLLAAGLAHLGRIKSIAGAVSAAGSMSAIGPAVDHLTAPSAGIIGHLFGSRGDGPTLSVGTDSTTLVLDGLHRQVRAGEAVIVSKGDEHRWFRIVAVAEEPRTVTPALTTELKDAAGKKTGSVTSPAVTVPVTTLTLDASANDPARKQSPADSDWSVADAAALVVRTGLRPAGRPVLPHRPGLAADDPLAVEAPVLPAPAAGSASGLPGRFLLVPAAGEGATVSGALDPATRHFTPDAGTGWAGTLTAPVTLHGNVLTATRGEHVAREVLGTGDATVAWQRFTLAKKPLTHLAAPGTDSGVRAALEVSAGGRRWREVPSFTNAGPLDEVYLTRPGPDGATDVVFGGGERGARLPTGAVVTARYRFGAGAQSPSAGSVTQIAGPVPGLAQVLQPVAAWGGADAEGPTSLRQRAPRSALLLGRAVSLADVAAVAAGVPGVENVRVDRRWSARRQRLVLRLAFIGPPELAPSVARAVRAVTDPCTPVEAEAAPAHPGRLVIDVAADPRYESATVAASVHQALAGGQESPLAPARLGVGGPLMRSVLFESVLAVEGAVAVRGVTLDGVPWDTAALTPPDGRWLDFLAAGELTVTAAATAAMPEAAATTAAVAG
ncbi:hypothetical protein [Streptomyces sp. NPDC059874]|uniref:hypothetical protein n=1 Tax=Streptomyces sp. NPDC059874 TaxID=3346983 RepID=UPI00365C0610